MIIWDLLRSSKRSQLKKASLAKISMLVQIVGVLVTYLNKYKRFVAESIVESCPIVGFNGVSIFLLLVVATFNRWKEMNKFCFELNSLSKGHLKPFEYFWCCIPLKQVSNNHKLCSIFTCNIWEMGECMQWSTYKFSVRY